MLILVQTLFILYIAIVVLSWLISAFCFFSLKSYAKSRGLPGAHAWKLFDEIGKDADHPLHRHLKGLQYSVVAFCGLVGVPLLVDLLVSMAGGAGPKAGP
jgi:hypothetical protein